MTVLGDAGATWGPHGEQGAHWAGCHGHVPCCGASGGQVPAVWAEPWGRDLQEEGRGQVGAGRPGVWEEAEAMPL